MSNGVTNESMLTVLPGVLKRDEGMYTLARLIGWMLGENVDAVNAPAIFQRIDELDEGLLDILAKDLKVDWYDYDASAEVKRNQIKNNWHVRKRIGTVGAVKTALCDVWPDTTVEEWYEWDGEPGYFRVLLSLDTTGTVPFSKAVRMIELFKPVRAHIDGYPILRIRCGIVIHTRKSDNILYHVPIAGTKPRYSTHGDKSYEDIVIHTDVEGSTYQVPVTGQLTAGTYPHHTTHGNVTDADISVLTESDGPTYHVPTAGTIPNYATHGDVGSGGLEVEAASVSAGYGVRKCGTSNNALF